MTQKTYTALQIRAAIAKMPLQFHEAKIPSYPVENPGNGGIVIIPDQLEVCAELRMRQIAVTSLLSVEASKTNLRANIRENLKSAMCRALFEFITGEKGWPTDDD